MSGTWQHTHTCEMHTHTRVKRQGAPGQGWLLSRCGSRLRALFCAGRWGGRGQPWQGDALLLYSLQREKCHPPQGFPSSCPAPHSC